MGRGAQRPPISACVGFGVGAWVAGRLWLRVSVRLTSVGIGVCTSFRSVMRCGTGRVCMWGGVFCRVVSALVVVLRSVRGRDLVLRG